MAASFTQIIFMVVIHCSYGLSFNFGPKFPELSKQGKLLENFLGKLLKSSKCGPFKPKFLKFREKMERKFLVRSLRICRHTSRGYPLFPNFEKPLEIFGN